MDDCYSAGMSKQASDPIVRKVMALPIPLWKRLNDWRFGEHISTEVEAVRRLIEAGLDAEEKRPKKVRG